MTIIVLLLLISAITRVLASNISRTALSLLAVSAFACIFATNQMAAFTSLTSFVANMVVAFSVAMVFIHGKVSINQFYRIVLFVTTVSILLSIAQMVASQYGIMLSLSPQQESQIALGFGPSFRTEANTYGKYLTFPFFLFIPVLLNNPKNRKIRIFYILMILAIIACYTRSAIIGTLFGLIYVFMWYSIKGRFQLAFKRFFPVLVLVVAGLTAALSGALGISEYAVFKIQNFFDSEEFFAGGSSAYRIEAMEAVINKSLTDSKYFWLGDGWGQTHVEVQGQLVQAGGADVVNILGFAGVIGVMFYLLMYNTMMRYLSRGASRNMSKELAMFSEGLLFAAVAMFITGQISGYLITPELYLLLGAAIYVSITHQASLRFRVE